MHSTEWQHCWWPWVILNHPKFTLLSSDNHIRPQIWCVGWTYQVPACDDKPLLSGHGHITWPSLILGLQIICQKWLKVQSPQLSNSNIIGPATEQKTLLAWITSEVVILHKLTKFGKRLKNRRIWNHCKIESTVPRQFLFRNPTDRKK